MVNEIKDFDLEDSLTDGQITKRLPRASRLNRWDFRDRDKLVIVPKGDEHTGSKYYDEDLDKKVIEWCLDTKAYVIGMGDAVECATRDSVGAGIYEQNEIVDTQIEHFIKNHAKLVKEGLYLGMHDSNHLHRVYKATGLDLSRLLAKEMGVKYFGVGAMHLFKIGNQSYTIYSTHGASGSRLPHTKIKACLDLANMCEAEIYIMAHTHQLSHHTRQYYTIDKKSKVVEEKEKHFLLTGSYLTHWGSYAMEKSYEPMKKGSPKIKLSGIEHQIRVSL